MKAIEEFRRPTDVKSLRRFLGMVGWFRKFIQNFSALADPLYLLLKKDAAFYWTDNQESAFQGLKDALVNSPVLAFPRFDLQFRLAVDTCNRGICFMLYQFHSDDPDSLRVVRFGSKALSKWQRSYGPTKLELLGMTTAIMECASYLRGQAFVVECDHQALRPMFQKKLKGAIYERWMTILQQFNFEIQYRSASQMVVADALSRGTPKDAEPMIDSPDDEDPHFPYNEDKTGKVTLPTGQSLASLLVHCDSSSAPEVNHVTVLPWQEATIQGIDDGYDADTDEDPQAVRGKKRNVPFKQKTQPVSVISSRNRLVEGISPLQSKVPCLHLPNKMGDKPTLHLSENELAEEFHSPMNSDEDSQPGTFVATTENDSVADNPAYVQTTDVDVTAGPKSGDETSYESAAEDHGLADTQRIMDNLKFTRQQILELQQADSALSPLISYIQEGTLPRSQKDARKILLEATDYILQDGLLLHSRVAKSRRAKTLNPFQIVLPESLWATVLKLYHESPCGAHGGISDTLDKLKDCYFFKGMSSVVADFVRSCEDCQRRKITQRHTKSGIKAFPTPSQPFQVLEADIFGPFPTSYSGKNYILTVVDMYSKFLRQYR